MVKDNITGTPNKDIDKIGRLLTLGLDISVGRAPACQSRGRKGSLINIQRGLKLKKTNLVDDTYL